MRPKLEAYHSIESRNIPSHGLPVMTVHITHIFVLVEAILGALSCDELCSVLTSTFHFLGDKLMIYVNIMVNFEFCDSKLSDSVR